MIVSIRDAAKLVGIVIVACCAVFVCTLFLNYHLDLNCIEEETLTEAARYFYEAQKSTAKVSCAVSGGCLLMTSVVMLVFYIRDYIDSHKKELGILKALGYSNGRLAGSFWIFGLSVLLGSAAGFGGSFLLMPSFYQVQNQDGILPEIPLQFHPSLMLALVVLPTVVFAGLAVLFARRALKRPVMDLLREKEQRAPGLAKKTQGRELPFLQELRRATVRSRKVLVFFIGFAAFCYAAMTQMSFSMRDLASEMSGMMMLVIGLVLAFTSMFMAIATVVRANTKTIATMRVLGYRHEACSRALLGGYRGAAYVGFAVGTAYQYGLLRLMVDIVFKDIENMPAYEFDFPMMVVSLLTFALVYELVMKGYAGRIRKISVKEISSL